MKLTITGTQKVEVEITDRELGSALHIRARQMYGCDFDDAGCDWLTDGNGNTYVADATWHASSNPEFAAMIDAANILMYGERRIVAPLVQPSMFPSGEDTPLFTQPDAPAEPGKRIELTYRALSVSSVDVCMDCIAYATPPGTVAGCWAHLEKMRERGEIPQTQYDEIRRMADFIEAD